MNGNMKILNGNKQSNPAKVQSQVGASMTAQEINAKFNSILSNMVQQRQEIQKEIESIKTMIRSQHLRTESFMSLALDKGIVSVEELEASRKKTAERIDNMINDLFNRQNGLTIVNESAVAGDVAYIQFTVLDTNTGMPIEECRRLNLPLSADRLPITQLKKVADDVIGKIAGECGDLQFDIPKEETGNLFAGMKVSLQYKVLEVKRVIKEEGIPPTDADNPVIG